MDPFALLRAALAGGPRQHGWLLRLHTPLAPEALVAESLDGVESVDGGGFRIELTALSIEAWFRHGFAHRAERVGDVYLACGSATGDGETAYEFHFENGSLTRVDYWIGC